MLNNITHSLVVSSGALSSYIHIEWELKFRFGSRILLQLLYQIPIPKSKFSIYSGSVLSSQASSQALHFETNYRLAIYKRSRGVEPRTTWNKLSSWRSEPDLNSGSPDFMSSTLTTWPHCLHILKLIMSKVVMTSIEHFPHEIRPLTSQKTLPMVPIWQFDFIS